MHILNSVRHSSKEVFVGCFLAIVFFRYGKILNQNSESISLDPVSLPVYLVADDSQQWRKNVTDFAQAMIRVWDVSDDDKSKIDEYDQLSMNVLKRLFRDFNFPKAAIDTLMTQAEKLVINFIDGVEAGCIACNENWLNTSFEDQQTKIFQNMAFRLFAKEHALNSYQIAFLLGINRQKAKDILSLRNFVTTSLLDEFLQCSLLKIQQAKDH